MSSIKNFKSKLLYRKSLHGDNYKNFHDLCDNQGPNLILIKSKEGFIIGGYTPLSWNNVGGWKGDNDTFLFSLTNEKIYPKINKDGSIFCNNN